ncbi:glutamyl aminopeptidase [Pelobates cultripes]|uniref:Aminopeptidase n=1 Tax=Pelobates cultripes TaxID=61616 RepID=A0AAD1W9G1_PELCU|nr:glutamyl aminopeptidase [Pelobates cultripes]
MQGIDMYENPKPKKYCIRGLHVAIIVGSVVVVGLAVGLGVGLTYPSPCATNEGEVTKPSVTTVPTRTSSSPSQPDQEFCPAKNDNSGEWKEFRLPTYINPVHYDLELQPFLDKDTYSGSVTIHINVSAVTKHLWLHIRETKLTGQPKLRKASTSQEILVSDCFQYTLHEYVVFESSEELKADETYLLTLQFAGPLNGSLVGFYRTTYVERGIIKSIAAADHEPTDARKSFPCFDEPNKKATYTITIIHEKEYNALSNMPIQATEDLGNGWNKTVFMKSVPMSTYLVCFAVHQFTYLEEISKRGIPLRIYVQPEQKHTAEYAANVTKIIFDFFEDYFNMSYSLPKLDQIAIPDFGTGAMENWGLITYRETNLLYDPNESATTNKQRVAAVIAHELTHQWFGNIVTMDWWDDLWLNEGFASFFEYFGVNEAEPTWNMLDQILIDDLLPVMKDDALLSSHPIIVTVSTPAEITSVFDAISYNKGASILRMLEEWITPEKFKIGCQNYLKKYEYMNAKTDDFWGSLAEASNEPVKEVMDTWTRQMGYPVLNVNSNTVIQRRFLLDSTANEAEPPSEFNYVWNIPVTFYGTANSGTTHTILYNKSVSAGLELKPHDPLTDGFLKINKKHFGFFRVNYDTHNWNELSNLLLTNHTIFSEGDRAGIIDDGFALASAEKLDYNITLDLTRYLEGETNYLPWQRAYSGLSYLDNMLESFDDIYPKFQEYFRKQVKPISNKLGWSDNGTDIEKLLRASVLTLACRMKDRDALNEASKQFQDWLHGKSIPVNLRQLVYRYGIMESGNATSWDYMFMQYQNTTLAQEKEKLLQGLASINDITLIDRFLSYLYNTTLIKSQDALNVIYYIAVNSKHGKQMAWDWVRINWDYLVSRYTINDRNLGRIVTRISGTFNTPVQLWQMENFFARYPNAGAGETPRKQALETVNNNIAWIEMNKDGIKSWLDAHFSP